jgi:hypothetical protein
MGSLERRFRYGLHRNEEELPVRQRLMRVMAMPYEESLYWSLEGSVAADTAPDPSLECPC